MELTKEITTPLGKDKVVFKTMITGAEREQVDAAQMKYVETKDGVDFNVKDMAKIATAAKHELLKISLVSINDDVVNCFERLQKMYEPDYNFVCEEIEETQKKMISEVLPLKT